MAGTIKTTGQAMQAKLPRAAVISAAALVMILLVLACVGFMQAGAAEQDGEAKDAAASIAETDKMAEELAESFVAHGLEYGKSETVAVKTDLSGKLDSIAVDEWIKNPEGLDTIEDVSSLKNITSDDDLEFKQDGESIVWTAGGDDVAYSGTTDRELPFGVSYRYSLDGVDVDPASLQNVSGELKVFITYENKTAITVSTGSGDYDVQDPFVMASIISFDPEHAQKVQVDNGTVVDQQGTLIAVGLGMPGLGKTLDIEDLAELPESVEITAQVKGFDMPDITTVVTDQVLGNVDAQNTDDVREKVDDAIGQLGNIGEALDGLAKGNKGIGTALGKIAEGQQAMADNLPNATEGLTTLAGVADAANQAVAGAAKVQGAISQNNAAGLEAQKQALESQQAAVESQAAATEKQQAAMDNQQVAVDALAGGVSMDDALAQQQDALAALSSIDAGKLTEDQQEAVAAAIDSLEQSIAQTQAQAGAAQGAFDQAQAALADSQTALGESQTSLADAQASLEGSGGSLQSAIDAANANEESAAALTQGLGVAAKQTEGLSEGLTQASAGFEQVQEGVSQLAEAMTQMSAANTKLGRAASKMSDGVSEAIDTVQSNIDEKIDLVNALSDYVNAKPAFGGSASGMPASTLFIVHAKAEATPLR